MTAAGGAIWLGWRGAQWLALCAALLTLVALTEAFLGHYRSGFAVRMQYSPFAAGAALLAALAVAVIAPDAGWTTRLLRITGLVATGLALVGVGYHWYYGVMEKPGGVRWLLHHLMYHAPLLAPLSLAIGGTLAVVTAASLDGGTVIGAIAPATATTLLTGAAMTGLVLQVAVLHYRGAFGNRAMWLPLVVGVAVAAAAAWHLAAGSAASRAAYLALLWAAFITGFVGWGFHLRGLDRMMAGLYVARQNLLEGPPPVAPLLFALVASAGIVGVRLL